MDSPRRRWTRFLPWPLIAVALALPVAVIGIVDEDLVDDSDLRPTVIVVADADNMREPWIAAQKAVALSKAERELLYKAVSEPGRITALTDELRVLLDTHGAVIEHLGEALTRPQWQWHPVTSPSSPIPKLLDARAASWIWILHASRLIEEGRRDDALAAALALARAGTHIEDNPSCLIDFLIGGCVRNWGADLAFSCMQHTDASAEDWDAFATELDGLRPDVDDFVHAMQIEYMATLFLIEYIEEHNGSPLGSDWGHLEQFQYKPNATRNLVAESLRATLADIRAGRAPRTTRPGPSGSDHLGSFLRGNLAGDIVAALIPIAPEVSSTCRVLDQVRVGARVRAYEERYGELPSDLTVLGLPHDPFPNTFSLDHAARTVGGSRGFRRLEF